MQTFRFGPLVNNVFNKCKSALRYTESCAAGTVFFGTVFDTDKWSPYEEIPEECKISESATIEDIDNKFFEACKKDNYNKLLNQNYDWINENGFWLESNTHLQQWLCMIDIGNDKFI